jgi:YD repeat-containing protein
MRDNDAQLIWEAYTEADMYSIEDRKPVLVPPATKEEAKKLMMSVADPDAEMHAGDEKFTGTPEEFIDLQLADDNVWPHEAVHALQEIKYPGWLEEVSRAFGPIDLADRFDDSTPAQLAAYHSRPTEIMAYAYDAANNIEKQKTLDAYEKLKETNPEAYQLFIQYVGDYR